MSQCMVMCTFPCRYRVIPPRGGVILPCGAFLRGGRFLRGGHIAHTDELVVECQQVQVVKWFRWAVMGVHTYMERLRSDGKVGYLSTSKFTMTGF